MTRIGIFFASETGNTAAIAQLLWWRHLPPGVADLHDIDYVDAAQMDAYDSLIIGTSTMGCGDYPTPLEAFLPQLDKIDFTGKTVALFGLGDQIGYPDEFCDALGMLYQELRQRGAHIVGSWPTAGYDYSASRADLGEGAFCGLVLDEDNQPQLTGHRLAWWVEAIRGDLLSGPSSAALRPGQDRRTVTAGIDRRAA